MTLTRGGYFVAFGALSIFFIAHLVVGKIFHGATDKDATKALLFFAMCLTLFITKADKPYLVQSIPLRVMIGIASILGLVVLATILRPY